MDDIIGLVWFFGLRVLGLTLFRQLLVWLGDAVERADWEPHTKTDSLSIPLLKGRKRSRPLHPAFKQAVAREAATPGSSSRSGPDVIRALVRHRKLKFWGRPKTAAKFDEGAAAASLRNLQSLYAERSPTTVSLAADATRFAGRDHLWVAMWLPALGTGGWAPPQARVEGMKRSFKKGLRTDKNFHFKQG